MAKASINFQKTKSNSVEETTRQFEASYLLPKELRKKNEYWDCGKSDAEVFEEQMKKAKPRGGRKPKLENSRWEAVLNLNEIHTMADVQKVAKRAEKKFNIICTRIAFHKDEGKVFIGADGTKSIKYNYHAHLNFVTYKDGRQNWRRQLIKRKDLSELQTEVAELLEMERGKVNSTAVRANHRELRQNYDAIIEQRKAPELKLTVSSLKKEISNLRIEMKTKNAELEKLGEQKVYTQDDYVALNALKKELKKANLQEIHTAFLRMQKELKARELREKEIINLGRKHIIAEKEKIQELEKTLSNALKSKKELEIENSTLLAEKSSLRSKLDELTAYLDCTIQMLLPKVKSLLSLDIELKAENIELKAENEKLKKDEILLQLWKENEKLYKQNQELEEQLQQGNSMYRMKM